ncbi:MAG: methylenetetrahydrofolate reductase [Syntrophobacterales bacterium]|jgi:5,10-methylenetetrahydrofolate reductase|nr:methylenetetrahydrofolate reductase [Syntrophobacterales bacterium]
MSKFRETLDAGAFTVVAELKPPKGIGVDDMLAPVKEMSGRVAAFGVPDNEHARMRLSALAASRLVKDAGAEVILHLTCRDRNRLGLESDLLGAASLGLENLLLISGDYVTLGDHPQAKPVYDADSVQLLQIAQGLMDGHDSVGLPLQGNPAFFLGAAVIPEAEPLAPQLLKFEKKLAAGAQFFVTPPVFDLEKLRRFREKIAAHPVKLLVSVKVLGAEEVALAAAGTWRKVYSVPLELVTDLAGKEPEEILLKGAEAAGRLVKQLKQEKLADGVYLKAKGRPDLFTKILEAAGL